MENQKTYFTIKESGKAWNECKQHELDLSMADAIAWANVTSKALKIELRLCSYKGYETQGTYINNTYNNK